MVCEPEVNREKTLLWDVAPYDVARIGLAFIVANTLPVRYFDREMTDGAGRRNHKNHKCYELSSDKPA